MWNLVTHFTCDNFNNIEFKERPPDSASACEWLGNFLINNKNYKTDKWFWTPNSANYEIDFLSPNDQNKKNNPLGVAAGQLKNDKIFLVSYLICYLPCPRTAFPVFYYLSLPSYLFVHSRTCSSLSEYIKKWDDMGSVNLAILFVFIGCGSNVFFLEHLINLDPTRNRF